MARYIDADAYEQKLADKDIFFPALYKNELNDMPTAEVVAKGEVMKILSDLKKQIHDRAVYPHNAGIKPYISLGEIDAIIEKEISHIKGEDE